MNQSPLDLDPLPKRTRKQEFLEAMDRVVPWAQIVALIEAVPRPAAKGPGGRPPFAIETMLRIHCLQLWWNLSDPSMEEELHERPLYRRFAGLSGAARMPDESTILRFRRLLEDNQLAPKVLALINDSLIQQGLLLKTGTVVDASIIAAPSSTKNSKGERDPEMHQTKKGNQWHFGMKLHIAVDAESGLVHSLIGTAANVNDVTQASALLTGEETDVWGDAGYQGLSKREEFLACEGKLPRCEIAMRPGKRKKLDKGNALHQLLEKAEQLKASIRAKVEHPFRVIKLQFGYAKVRYRGLAKNTARLTMLAAMSNLWMVRRQLIAAQG
jgi:transposase, IS5 family